MPGAIQIQETDTELCLFLPFDQKDRAKGIEGRRWSPERRCWIYPKTGKVYDALIAEFRDDLVDLRVQRPDPVEAAAGESAEDLRAALERQLDTISHQLRALSAGRESERDVRKLEDAYRTTLQEAENLRLEVRERANRIAALERELEAARREAEEAKRANALEPAPSFEDELKQQAILATARDPDFMDLMRELQLDYHFPTEIGKHLERRLCKLLKSNGTLDKLINRAHEQNKLDKPAYHLAHTIRLQRNSRAHNLEDPRLIAGRANVCLFAAALLFPLLPEGD